MNIKFEKAEGSELIGERLRLIVEAIAKDSTFMSKLIGVEKRSVNRLLTGETPLSFEKMQILYEELGVNLNFLVAGDETVGIFVKKEAVLPNEIKICSIDELYADGLVMEILRQPKYVRKRVLEKMLMIAKCISNSL